MKRLARLTLVRAHATATAFLRSATIAIAGVLIAGGATPQVAGAQSTASAVGLPATTPDGHLVSRSHLFGLPDGAVGYVPASATPDPPLLVLLHGAGHRQVEMVEHFEAEADERGILLLAPDSRGVTWDSVLDAKGPPSTDSPLANELAHRFARTPDSARVEKAIANLERVIPFDQNRVVLAGFSDGATFALAMGMSRAYRFAAVIAWSPGIAIRADDPARGRRVFVSHGRQDPILQFAVTCSDIVPLLQNEGAAVTFLAFDGQHEAPLPIKDAFLDAVFGPRRGQVLRPLPSTTHDCGASGGLSQLPGLP